MKQYRILVCASVFFAVAAAGCGGAPETTEEAEPAVGLEEAAAPEGEPAERPRLATPVRGVAQLGYTAPVITNEQIDGRNFVVTTMEVKNMADGSIAGLMVDEFWYDRPGNTIGGDNYRHPTPLQPGEVITITLETLHDPRMDRNQYSFTHANGDIEATLQETLEASL